MACQYGEVHAAAGATLLCLPAKVRSRIYIEAGLLHECRRVPLTPPRRRFEGDSVRNADWHLLRKLRYSLDLMQTCRLIYEETSRIFYSTNRFVAQYLDDSKLTNEGTSCIHYATHRFVPQYLENSRLSALQYLRPQSIAYLTHLTLYLRVTRCKGRDPYPKHSGQSWDWADWWVLDDAPLSSSSPRDRTLLRRWSEVASHLAANVTPSSLRLCLGCDVEDTDTAMLVLTPLLQWPRLASCVIRLSQTTNMELQDLAGQFVGRLTGSTAACDMSQFPFMSLPRELRLEVLQYTDLVTPLCEVTWTRELSYHTKFLSWRPTCCWDDDGGRWMQAARFRSCYQYSMGCFCPKYHAVFPAACDCWLPPLSLLLVSKLMKADAEAVFFRRNRFVVLHSGGKHFVAAQTPSQLEASYFLKSVIATQNLAYIRFLELAFPPFEKDYLKASDPAHQDWLETIDHLQTHMCISQLTLRIYMREQIPVYFGRLEVPFRPHMTREKLNAVLCSYSRLLYPLKRLKGLYRLFLHLAVPSERNSSGKIARTRSKVEVRERSAVTIQRFLERRIMGDDYDSIRLGKQELADSQWRTDEMFDFIFRMRRKGIRNVDVSQGRPERPPN